MANVDETRKALGLTSSAWKNYIHEGTVTKKKQGEYDIHEVAQQIMRWQSTSVRKLTMLNTTKETKIKKLNAQLLVLEGKLSSVTGDGNDEDNPIENHDRQKKKLDIQLAQQKLIKMKYEQKVREKLYMPTDNVFTLVTNISSEFAAFLDPLAGRLKQDVPDMSARAYDNLQKSLAVGRNSLARHIEGKTVNELIQLFNPTFNTSSTESTDDT